MKPVPISILRHPSARERVFSSSAKLETSQDGNLSIGIILLSHMSAKDIYLIHFSSAAGSLTCVFMLFAPHINLSLYTFTEQDLPDLHMRGMTMETLTIYVVVSRLR